MEQSMLAKQERGAKGKKKKGGGFQAMQLSPPVFKAIMAKGYNLPTPIQRKVIPKIRAGLNIVATSRTGSGKTAAFLIPIIEKLSCHSQIVGARCVILSPTRELALQTAKFCKDFSKNTDLKLAVIVGGASLEGQFEVLAQNPDIVIATPGRFLHHLKETKYSLKRMEVVVYDEADRLFELGFMEQIKEINDMMPQEKQIIMMSATMPKELQEFAATGIREYNFLQLDKESKISDKLLLHFLITRPIEKFAALIYILGKIVKQDEMTLVFVSTKYHVQYLEQLLPLFDIRAVGIYGDLDPQARNINFARFSRKDCNVLLVTDLAARGLDVPLLDNVVHFDFPSIPKVFIHRTGRTARAGKAGKCYCLLTPEELSYMFDVSTFIGRRLANDKDNATTEELLDTNVGYYGIFPTNMLSEECQEITEQHKRVDELDTLLKSVKNGYSKYFKMKSPASKHASFKAKEIVGKIKVHPLFVGKEIRALAPEQENMLEGIRSYKPKQAKKMAFVNPFTPQIQKLINYSKVNKGTKEEPLEENKDEIESEDEKMQVEPAKVVEVKPIVHKRKNAEKKAKPVDFKDPNNYISLEPTKSMEQLRKLWGGEEPIDINDAIVELAGDQGDTLKPHKKRTWDKTKKRYVNAFVDPEGRIVKAKENATGKKGVEKLKEKYNKWIKKTHVRIQNVGETEDSRLIENAKVSFWARKDIKKNRGKVDKTQRPQKTELKSAEQILKAKKKDFKSKRMGRVNPAKKYVKANRKIVSHSCPSRSMMVRK